MSTKRSIHIVASGRVQGVGFRYFAREKALELELKGWVRNCRDRTVELEVEGEPYQLEIFLDHLRIGNGYSRVDKLQTYETTPLASFDSFQIKY